ncbi:MAG: VWA domain-containing protein [Acidobacteriota bacterium]
MIQLANTRAEWLLLAFPLLLGFAVVTWLRFHRRARKWGGPDRLKDTAVAPARERDLIRSACFWTALALVLIAFARPQWGEIVENVKRVGLDLVVVLDTSRSMLVQDAAPDRLERAKLEIRSLLQEDREDRVGLVAVSGVPVVLSPLTQDTGAINLLLDIADQNLIPPQGTDLGKGITSALRLFPSHDDRDRVIIIFSDGEDQAKDSIPAAKTAAALGVKIFCVGVGTPQGGVVPGPNGKPMMDPSTGEAAVSRMHPALLKRIAALTDGRYWSLEGTGSVVGRVREELMHLKRREYASKSQVRRQDHFALFLIPALLLLAGAVLIPDRKKWPPVKEKAS